MTRKSSAFVIRVRGTRAFLVSLNPLRWSTEKEHAIRIANLTAAVKVASELNSLCEKDRFSACFFAQAE